MHSYIYSSTQSFKEYLLWFGATHFAVILKCMALNPWPPPHTQWRKETNTYTTNIQEGWSAKEVGTNFSGKYENKDFTEKMILELTLNYEWDFSRFFFEEEWPGKEKSL